MSELLWLAGVSLYLFSGGWALANLYDDEKEGFGALFFFCLILGPFMAGTALVYRKKGNEE